MYASFEFDKNSLKVLCVYKLSKKITKFVLILSRPLSKFHWIQQNREKIQDPKSIFFEKWIMLRYIRYEKCHVMIVMIIVIPISPQVIVCWDWLSGPCSCDDEVCQKQRLTHLHVNRQPCQKKEKFKKHFQKDDFNEVYQNFEIITSKLLLFESYSHYKDN